MTTANSRAEAYAPGPVLTPLQRAILVELARECWPVRTITTRYGDGLISGTMGDLAMGLYVGLNEDKPDFDPEHAAWLGRHGDSDWVRLRGVTRTAYRRHTGAEGVPSASFRVSFHRAIRTLAAKGMLELVNKQPRTRANTRRKVEALSAARPTLTGLLAVADEQIADDYGGEAFPQEPGHTQAYRVSRTYWRGAFAEHGCPEPVQYTYVPEATDLITNARRRTRWVSQTWREWWDGQRR